MIYVYSKQLVPVNKSDGKPAVKCHNIKDVYQTASMAQLVLDISLSFPVITPNKKNLASIKMFAIF